MDMQINVLDIFNKALKICKEKECLALKQRLHNSYIKLMAVEADCRREKASTIIRSMQILDRELTLLKFEYGRVKGRFSIDNISAIEKYINEIEHVRKKLALEKRNL